MRKHLLIIKTFIIFTISILFLCLTLYNPTLHSFSAEEKVISVLTPSNKENSSGIYDDPKYADIIGPTITLVKVNTDTENTYIYPRDKYNRVVGIEKVMRANNVLDRYPLFPFKPTNLVDNNSVPELINFSSGE